MQSLVRLVVKRNVALAVVALSLLLAAIGLTSASRLRKNDDVLAFLPKGDADVASFYEVNRRFGGLDVAMIGVRGGDPLAPPFLARLRAATRALNETEGVAYAMSLANVEDFTPDPEKGGIGIDYLIPAAPADPAALREKVLSRDQVVGNLISADGKAILIYGFPAYGADPKAVAARMREVVEKAFPGEEKFWGGTPFVSGYIYDASQEDIRRLAPWAALVTLALTLVALRDAIATGLALLTTALAIVMTLGLMGALSVEANVMVGSMPVIIFALGSASVLPVILRYQALALTRPPAAAIAATLASVGRLVLVTGLIAAATLLSLATMDIAPLRTFGVFTAAGLTASVVLALTFVPAAIGLIGLRGRAPGFSRFGRAMAWLGRLATDRRGAALGVLGALAALSALSATRLESRMDNAAFYAKDSPPGRADAFLAESFGGAQFFQIEVEGDMNDPRVLREIRAVADRITLVPHVTSVNHVGSVVAKINEAMEGDERIPDSAAKVGLLYGFLAGKRAVTQLATPDRRFALLQIKVDVERRDALDALLRDVETLAAATGLDRYVVERVAEPAGPLARARLVAIVRARILAVCKAYGVAIDAPALAALDGALSGYDAAASRGEGATAAEAAILAFLGSEEFIGELPQEPAGAAVKVAAALAPLSPRAGRDELAAALGRALDRAPDGATVAELIAAIDRPLREIQKRQEARAGASVLAGALRLRAPEGARGQRFSVALANALLDLDAPEVLVPAAPGAAPAGALRLAVTGLPVMNRGLARSIADSQRKGVVITLALLFVALGVLYRSPWTGLLAMSPAALTMLVVYGAMAALGLSLDVGTSMLASLIAGAGVTYAAHILHGFRTPEGAPLADAPAIAARASAEASPFVWANALIVAAGFFVLTRGEARPLKSVGGLTAAAMITAALAAFTVLPALARRRSFEAPLPTDSDVERAGFEPSANGGASPRHPNNEAM
jgi:uncharacterized protein